MATKINNWFITTDKEDVLVYAIDTLTECQIKDFIEKCAKVNVDDIYQLKDEEIQYYIIDGGRVFIDTPTKAERMLEYINTH